MGPYCFDVNLTGASYLDFLRGDFIPELITLYPDIEERDRPRNGIFFQQCILPIMQHLPENLEDLKARIRHQIHRIPPEVIDSVQKEFINHLDYCQQQLYATPMDTIEELRETFTDLASYASIVGVLKIPDTTDRNF
ncbi:hypothetical protein NQ318_013727 [Aromia moschata]|uniref:Uncharacterized protein n=1 Tax=Aromia moschata TaxID=1265417 RepID=A0AAV8Z8H8_9CUCU|nr:hypothetical protein NQ318_013727 [Aromia moschata]